MNNLTKRAKYHSSIVLLYLCHKEHLLPDQFRKSIPYSTAATWRKSSETSFVGHEFSSMQQQGLEWVELFLKYQNLKHTILFIAKVWIRLSDLFVPLFNKKIHQQRVINEIQYLCFLLPKKIVLKIFHVSSQSFTNSLNKLKYACLDSSMNLCRKKYPKQLTLKEVGTMKELFYDPRFVCWPISALAYYANRNNILHACLTTWYKYIHLLGIKRAKFFLKPKTAGIVSSHVNQFLHVDTTFFTCGDDTKHAIVFVSDNYSKAILGWSRSTCKSANNVKQALIDAIHTIGKYHPEYLCATLVADGGSENHAFTIKQLLEDTDHPKITKIIALKDIAFSNSPIEAIHKIMKKYLRHQKPENARQLDLYIEQNVYDYTFVRPHGSLKGFIPIEVYSGKMPSLDFSSQRTIARKERSIQNSSFSCITCIR